MTLLERDHVLASLAEYADSARAGEGRLVLVSGEAGVGKSVLVEQFAHDTPDLRTVRGACDGLFTPRPLGPLFDVADQLGGELLAACRGGAPREELFDALLRQLDQPGVVTMLVIEDVHWADESTLDLVRFLGRRVRTLPALLVVTYRDDELAAGAALRIVLGELATQRSTRRIVLSPLSVHSVAALAAGSGMPADELHRLTGGNPFFVTEIIQSGSAQIPPSARDAVLARVARLSDDARRALEAAALVGTQVEPWLLGPIAAATPEHLDELVTAGVLVSDGPLLRFRHEITRLTVAGEISSHRSTAVHVQALAALQGAGCEDDDARLAYHAEGAGDAAAVLRFAPAAARRASLLASHREAASQYERALQFAAGMPAVVVAELYDNLARETSLTDSWERCAAAGECALALWREVDDPLREGDALIRLSHAMWRLCRGPESHEYAELAVARLEPLGPTAELADACNALASCHFNSGDVERGRELAHRAELLASTLSLPNVLSDALNTQAVAAFALGAAWEPMMLQALQTGIAARVDGEVGRAYANLHAIYTTEKRWGDSERAYREGIAYCDDHDIGTYGYCLRGSQGQALVIQSRWDEAIEICTPMLETTAASPANRIVLTLTIARAHMRRGDPRAGEFLDEAIRYADATEEAAWLCEAYPYLAESRWLAGEADRARDAIERVAPLTGSLDGWNAGLIASWCRRLGAADAALPAQVARPYERELAGDFAGAVAAWDLLGCPYDAALACYDTGTEDGLREALRRFDAIGATAAADATRREMRRRGLRSVPTGAQPSTRAHPLGLTRREREVLDLICAGHTNNEISERLFISPKTVDHHVSAVLAKLGTPTRSVAAKEAARLGLVGATGK